MLDSSDPDNPGPDNPGPDNPDPDNPGPRRITARELNRATLARQLLLRREPLDVADAVRRVGAVQAQEPASPYLALWNRVTGFDPADLDAAFAAHAVVKATLMRITLHAVHAEDYPAFHTAMLPSLRAARLPDRRFTDTGMTAADADALASVLTTFAAQPRTGAEIAALIEERVGALAGPRTWWALRTFAPLFHVPVGEVWSFGRKKSFVTARTPPEPDRDRAVGRLARRYLAAFGPASVPDIARFTLLRRPVVRAALLAQADELEELEGPDGIQLFDLPGAARPAGDTPAPPRLMAMWDSILLAYADASRVIAPEYRALVTRRNGDVLPTLLVDGYVAGVWRPVTAGIEATAFRPLREETWSGLAGEASALTELLASRDPAVYRRYAHWWDTLPAAQVRVLPGAA